MEVVAFLIGEQILLSVDEMVSGSVRKTKTKTKNQPL